MGSNNRGNVVNLDEKRVEKFIKDNIAELAHQEVDWINEHGYYVHYVAGVENAPEHFVDVHTHGLPEVFDHHNLQLTIGISPQQAGMLLASAVAYIRDGNELTVGDHSGIIEEFDVRIVMAVSETGETLCRIILPDANGNLSLQNMEGYYAGQYHGL